LVVPPVAATKSAACAEVIVALSPMAAMDRPQNLRMGPMFLGGAAWPGGAMWCMFGMLVMNVVFMVFGSMDYFLMVLFGRHFDAANQNDGLI
jgi:integral membrane sensor domain MASE1